MKRSLSEGITMIRHSKRKSSQTIGRSLIIFLYVLFPAIVSIGQTAPPEPTTIGPGSEIQRELKAGETQLFRIQLSSGQFLHVKVEQNGIDVTVDLLKPNGESMVALDGPSGRYGPEDIAVIAESSGEYQLKVISPAKTAPAGRFKVAVVNLRSPIQSTRNRVDAESALVE